MSDKVSPSEFIVRVEFKDGGTVTLGMDDEIYIEPEEGATSATLNEARLDLIRRLQVAQDGE